MKSFLETTAGFILFMGLSKIKKRDSNLAGLTISTLKIILTNANI